MCLFTASSRLILICVASPSYDYLFIFDSLLWHSLQRGMYISAPPISVLQSVDAVRNVKCALFLHSLHTADSLVTFSQRGIRFVMFYHGSRKNVPVSEEMITILPAAATMSENSAISVKNYPSSIAIQSYARHKSPISPNLV